MTLRARFVDSISATPTVRLDLTAAPWSIQASSRFDAPSIKRSRSSTMLMDGSIYPASAYDERVLELHLQLDAATNDDVAVAIQQLSRELDRPAGNFFEYRLPNQTSSVFFRTIRLAMESIDVATDGTLQTIVAPVLAEPFAYGLREDPVVDAVVNANPAAGSNGCFVDVTGVKGDVETPALIRWPETAVIEDLQSLFSIRRRGTPSQMPFLFQAESMTQGPNTTVQANSTLFSGAGSNYSRCTLTTGTFAGISTASARLSFTDLGTASVDLRGIYRVFLRYRKNTSADVINLRARWGGGDNNNMVINNTFPTINTTFICMADLGLISIPSGVDPVYDHRTGEELVVADRFLLQIQAERLSGSGTLDLDYVLLIPADDRLAIVEWDDPESAADRRWLDAHDNSIHARSSSNQVVSAAAARGPVGSLPMLSPNQTNRIFMLYAMGSGWSHTIATTTVVSVSYFPRYLSIRPAST